MKITRRELGIGTVGLALGACGGQVARDAGESDTNARPSPPGRPPSTFDPAPPRRGGPDPGVPFAPVTTPFAPPAVVWSWTTEEQIAELRRDRVVFTRESSPTLGRGRLFDVLDARAADGDDLAVLLTSASFAKGRFGWGNPWATAHGAGVGETYGSELLRIEMKEDTWYARVVASRPTIDVVDAKGAPVPRATALASFGRVGGVLFYNDTSGSTLCATHTGADGGLYREIYLAHEPRIARVSHRTAEILAEIDASHDALTTLALWLEDEGFADLACSARPLWDGEVAPRTTLDRYVASLAFATTPYGMMGGPRALADTLELRRFALDPFEIVPA